MNALFVLLPPGHEVDGLLESLPEPLRRALSRLRCRRYPPIATATRLHDVVRSARDPVATTWLAGTAKAIAFGALLGGITNGILAGVYGMLGGLLEIAIPLGVGGGAFLGGFSAVMRGTETPRPEVVALFPHVRAGASLVTWAGDDGAALRELAAACTARGMPTMLRS